MNNVESDFEFDNNTLEILNNQIVKAIFDLLYKKDLINKKEFDNLLKQI